MVQNNWTLFTEKTITEAVPYHQYARLDGFRVTGKEFFRVLLTKSLEEVEELSASWLATYNHNNRQLSAKLKNSQTAYNHIVDILESEFKEVAFNANGKLKAKYSGLHSEKHDVLVAQMPKVPAINQTIYSEKAGVNINISCTQGSESQHIDLVAFYTRYKEKEAQLVVNKVPETVVLTPNMLKCKEYIESQERDCENLVTENDYNRRATRIQEDILIEAAEKEHEIYIDFCGDCDVWYPHDSHRCSCGNRRCTFDSMGTFLGGDLMVYPVGY